MANTDILSWSQVKNWLPIVSGALVVAGAFFSVRMELAILREKLDQVVSAQERYLQKETAHENLLNNHETRIVVLEIKKTSQAAPSAQLASRHPEPTLVITPIPVNQSVTVHLASTPQPEVKPTPEPTKEPEPTQGLLPIITGLLERI